MDFDSPDVMKDFPGLYASELNKKCNNDSDYSDETDKVMKKDMLIGKRRDKKEKKDKERGYAALEGESSADENCKSSRSPSKTKKTKSFKFTKSKEKREKSREKEKEATEKKKDRDKKSDKKVEKEKGKKLKQNIDDTTDIAEALPIFGVNLEAAIERGKCHDGIDIPLPIRECIDYIETIGISFENVYKISGTKSKVLHLKKMYNHRENVNLNEYDVPTATSLLKMFLRDLPEPVFTNDLIIRFEEAGAILNLNTREKHLRILVENLPAANRMVLSWLIIHLDNISLNEKQNKMNKQNLAAALNHTFHISTRLLNALLYHGRAVFPDTVIINYIPPLSSGMHLPQDLDLMQVELRKQESLLTQIHTEMNVASISKQREELLWEVQRLITQLKRRIKISTKDKEAPPDKLDEKSVEEKTCINESMQETSSQDSEKTEPPTELENKISSTRSVSELNEYLTETSEEIQECDTGAEAIEESDDITEDKSDKNEYYSDSQILFLQLKNAGLMKLKESLQKSIQAEKTEIANLKSQLQIEKPTIMTLPNNEHLEEIMSLLQKENQILRIKKINLVRKIIEQQELCIDLRAKLELIPQFQI